MLAAGLASERAWERGVEDAGLPPVDERGRATTLDRAARAARLRLSPSRLFRPPPSTPLVPPSFPSSLTIHKLAADPELDAESQTGQNQPPYSLDSTAANSRPAQKQNRSRRLLDKAAHLLGRELREEKIRIARESRPSKLSHSGQAPPPDTSPPPPPLPPAYTTTFVHLACARGDLPALLFNPAASAPFLERPDEHGRTPLQIAAMGGWDAVVQVLIEGVRANGLRGRAMSVGNAKAKDGGWWGWVGEVASRAPLALPSRPTLPPITHSLNLPDPTGRTPAHWAALLGHPSVLRTLRTTAGIRVRWLQADAVGRTCLHLSVMCEREDAAEECLREVIMAVEEAAGAGGSSGGFLSGASNWWPWQSGPGSSAHNLRPPVDLYHLALNLPDAQGMTPAHLACALDRPRLLGVLLDSGVVGLDATDADGKTAFHWAAGVKKATGPTTSGRGSRVASSGTEGGRRSRSWSARATGSVQVPVLVAGPLGKEETEDVLSCAQMVLARAPFLAPLADHEGRTALHLAALANNPDLVERLAGLARIGSGVDLDARDSAGRTPLHWAAVCGHTSLVGRMIALGCDPGMGDTMGGATAVHYAAAKNHAGCVAALMDDGVGETSEPNQKAPPRGYKIDNHGRTPLHWAAERGHVQAVRVMVREENLARGVDPNSGDARGATALHVAAGAGHTTCTAVLLELRSPGPFSDHAAAPTNSAPYLVNPDVLDHAGQTPLFRAVSAGHADIAALLCSAGARIDVADGAGRTALHHAAWKGDLQMVSLLTARARGMGSAKTRVASGVLEERDLVGARDGEGRTALMLAAAAGWDDVLKYLHENGAWELDEQDDAGLSAMHLAVCTRKISTVALLIKLGANPNLLDRPYPFSTVPLPGLHQRNSTSQGRGNSRSANTRSSFVSGLSSVYADTTDGDETGNAEDGGGTVELDENAQSIPPRTPLDLADELGDEEMYDLIRRNGGWPGSVMMAVEVAVRLLQQWWRGILNVRAASARKWDDERAAARLPPSAAPLHRTTTKFWESQKGSNSLDASMTSMERDYFGGEARQWQDLRDIEASASNDSGTAVGPGRREHSADSRAPGSEATAVAFALPPLPGNVKLVESAVKIGPVKLIEDEVDDGMTTMERRYFQEAVKTGSLDLEV
ncbi:hypothetical protein HDU93_003789 [Gonapodya sp. JEL0774]|nr:hypothetical protein HDU93_003789 [Gonapodya sp. JEL0774]